MNEKKHFDRHFENDYLAPQSDQTPYSFAEEWEWDEQPADLDSEPISAKIIARMPDLGMGDTLLSVADCTDDKTKKPVAAIAFLRRFSGRVGIPSFFRRSKRAASDRFEVPEMANGNPKARGLRITSRRKIKVVATVLVVAVVLSAAGGFVIHKNNKRKAGKTEAASVENKEAKAAVPAPTPEKKIATTSTPTGTPADKPAAVAKAVEKPAVKPAVPAPAKTPEKPAAVAKAAEKPAVPAPVKATEKPVAQPATPAKAVAAAASAPNSAWDRSTTDNYTPWTMTSPGRLEAAESTPKPASAPEVAAAATESPGFSTTHATVGNTVNGTASVTPSIPAPATPSASTSQPMLSMQPMSPLQPTQQPIPQPVQQPITPPTPAVIPPQYVPTHAYATQQYPYAAVQPAMPNQAVAPVPSPQPAPPYNAYGNPALGNPYQPMPPVASPVPQQSMPQQAYYQQPQYHQQRVPQPMPQMPSQMPQPQPSQAMMPSYQGLPNGASYQAAPPQSMVNVQGNAVHQGYMYRQGAVPTQGMY